MFIRRALPTDMTKIVRLAMEFHREAPNHRDYPFDTVKVEQLVLDAMKNPDWLATVACDEDGVIIGMGLFYCMEMFFSHKRESGDLTLYVAKPQRGTRAALLLLKEYIKWAKEKGASRIQVAPNTGIEQERTQRFLHLLGFETKGSIEVLLP